MNNDMEYNGLSRADFYKAIKGDNEKLDNYVETSIDRLFKVFASALLVKEDLKGPTLDCASADGILYRPIREFLPSLLPYSITEIFPREITIDNVKIDSHKFECDKDRIPLPDKSIGAIFFCDVLEHLIVDPMWTILEFNRVLRDDGHIIISTPNACAIRRIQYIYNGINPGSELEFKPSAIYQRHNREWTPREVGLALSCAGFEEPQQTTHPHLLSELDLQIYEFGKTLGLIKEDTNYYGQEIFMVAKKKEHTTLDSNIPKEKRFPKFLYSQYQGYQKRPEKFPIQVGWQYS